MLHPSLLNPAFLVDGDEDVQTHDGPVDKAKLAKVSTTLLEDTRGETKKKSVVIIGDLRLGTCEYKTIRSWD